MIKYFCDFCGNEMTEGRKLPDTAIGQLKRNENRAGVYIVVRDENKQVGDFGGEVCRYCVLDAVMRFDDRARQA